MSDLEQSGDELTHHDSGYDRAKPVQHKFSEIFGENIFSLNNLKEYVSEARPLRMKPFEGSGAPPPV